LDLEQFPFPATIDNTMREEWWKCRHSFFRRHIQGLQHIPLGAPGEQPPDVNIHLHFGGALARGLEITRKSWTQDGKSNDQAMQDGAEALITAWGEAILPPPTTRNEENKTLQSCLLAHQAYFREWPLDDPMQKVATAEGQAIVEFSGALPIPGCYHPVTKEQLLYSGRFDGMLDRGKLWGLDDKTTGSQVSSSAWRAQWQLNGQFTGYCWLAQGYGFRVSDFLVHGIQILKTDIRLAEVLCPRPAWMVEQWLGQLQADVKQMIVAYEVFILGLEVDGFIPSHPFAQALGHACVSFNQPCQYLTDLCGQPNPDDWLDRFRVERWNPLRRKVDE
jgi:hypothetical protein